MTRNYGTMLVRRNQRKQGTLAAWALPACVIAVDANRRVAQQKSGTPLAAKWTPVPPCIKKPELSFHCLQQPGFFSLDSVRHKFSVFVSIK